jgi:ribosome-associated translation inhibitor RaiA
MQIQINSDKNIAVNEELKLMVDAEIEKALVRWEQHITRVEVHLSDLNSSQKAGAKDMRCLIEVRFAGRQPASVSDETDTVEQSVKGAAGKLHRLMESTIGKLDAK